MSNVTPAAVQDAINKLMAHDNGVDPPAPPLKPDARYAHVAKAVGFEGGELEYFSIAQTAKGEPFGTLHINYANGQEGFLHFQLEGGKLSIAVLGPQNKGIGVAGPNGHSVTLDTAASTEMVKLIAEMLHPVDINPALSYHTQADAKKETAAWQKIADALQRNAAPTPVPAPAAKSTPSTAGPSHLAHGIAPKSR